MGIFSHGNEVYLQHVSGIDSFGSGWAISAIMTDHDLILKPRAIKKFKPVQLPLNNIESAKNELIQEVEHRSAFKRAFIGEAVAGHAGAVIVALTSGDKPVNHVLFVIRTKDGKEIILRDTGASLNLNKWIKALNGRLCNVTVTQQNEVV